MSGVGDPKSPAPGWLEDAVRLVRGGGVVALPFERLFGLAADALDPAAVERVAAVKGRDALPRERRPLPVILPDAAAIDQVAREVPPLAMRLAKAHWPGLLTLLVPARDDLPERLVGAARLVGVRLPGPSPAADLARASGRVLTATSANPSGAADTRDSARLHELDGIDMVVPGEVPGPPGSTVVDCSGDEPVVVRAGALALGADAGGGG